MATLKLWHFFGITAVVVAGGAYLYLRQDSRSVSSLFHLPASSGNTSQKQSRKPSAPAVLDWQTLVREGDGFAIDLPAPAHDEQVPAYNDAGKAEPIRMVVASPNAETTFAVSWQDEPPVARTGNTPEQTLDAAREGMLARTQTSLVNESRLTYHDNPALDISARNAQGGVLNVRFVYARHRLYMLMALFPSASARREQDVERFFDSFETAKLSDASDTQN